MATARSGTLLAPSESNWPGAANEGCTPIQGAIMSDSKLNLLSFSGKTRILHLTWFAFFLTFLVWFNHAPLLIAIKDSMGLSDQQIKTLLILNVALTIPARIIVGMWHAGGCYRAQANVFRFAVCIQCAVFWFCTG
jgi:nitrate/nitrite transporter NarK